MHIIRHPSLDALTPNILSSAQGQSPLLPFLISRRSDLVQEFAFSPAHDNPAQHPQQDANAGSIYELRSYDLIPGTMLEWEAAWRKGIQARSRFIVSSCLYYLASPGMSADQVPSRTHRARQERGSPKSDSFIPFTTCGNTPSVLLNV